MARTNSMYDLQPGYAVFTVDGDELGRVKEVRDGAFKIDAPWKGDYWLPVDMVISVIPGDRVTVDATGDEIRGRRVERPPMGPREYRERYEQGYRAGMDFDPESSVYRDRRADGGAWGWEARGFASHRESDAGGRTDRPIGPERGRDTGRWGEPLSGEEPWQRPRTDRSDEYRGYAPEDRQRWRFGRRGGEVSQRPESAGYRAYRDYGPPPPPPTPAADRPSYVGHGPKGYQRTDDRIFEDICEALSENPDLNPSDIEVKVEHGEVRLTGTVETRFDKRLAEDIACSVRGVKDVRNELRAQTSMMTGVDHPRVGW